ncbi:RIP metalloprotease RseP [Pseudoxanthomonas kalamensis DSM 18571]|uniref:RIP metalloprotease RseP n=1 Tax=Pseudoxanthomonas kalamensis TaxID=289483 RepID=UPI001390988A|nr:RIP metalloprotease RseP [Pseudoxanthomonas kalamensis]KAF1708564.1 RIP metalloprotease RseP [Pseudoxanthomonas kalamensis DSM 18571]
MSEIAGSIWWMLVALGVLVTFHEFGHYWVARRCGVKVLRFSVGFGKPLWSRRDRHGTEFAIAALPLGGYVKMLDENEGDVPADQLGQAFNRKPVLQRIAVVAAGPIANLLLCVALLWAMFVIGKQDYSATIGQTQGLAAEAGFRSGERVLQVGDRLTDTAGEAAIALTKAAIDHQDVRVKVESADGDTYLRELPLSRLPAGFDQENVVALAGLDWWYRVQPAIVDTVAPEGPAAGLVQPGDTVVAVDGERIDSWKDFLDQVAALVQRGGEAMIEVERDGERHAFPMQPRQLTQANGEPYLGLGIGTRAIQQPHDTTLRHGPLAAIPAAFRETGRMASDTLGMIRRMLTGAASVKNISGPITIARVANVSAKLGVDWFLWFLAAISLSLAIINLLPIPVLDGGHLLYYLIELVKGSPLSERSMIAGQYLGLAMLAGLMGLAFYNDILRLVT